MSNFVKISRYACLLSLALLTACGGGGGGASSNNSGSASSGNSTTKNCDLGSTGGDNSWLNFESASLALSAAEGQPLAFSIKASTIKNTGSRSYLGISDSDGLTSAQVNQGENDLIGGIPPVYSYKVATHLSSNLSVGVHKGCLKLAMYKDYQHTQLYPDWSWIIPYQVTINPRYVAHRLLPTETGVAFTSVPGWSRLTRTIAIKDNMKRATAWEARSDQSWLSVTSSGNTGSGSSLVLTADPSSLSMNSVSFATVTLSSSDASVKAPEKIAVAIWRGSSTPQQTSIKADYAALVADPVAPYVYLATSSGQIDTVNVYTAQRVGASIATGSSGLIDMTISQDGSMLYALDASRTIVAVDLQSRLVRGRWPLQSTAIPLDIARIKYIRPNGVGVLLVDDGGAYLASSGAVVSSNTGITSSSAMAATSDGSVVYVHELGISPATTIRLAVDYSDFGSGALITEITATARGAGGAQNGEDVATTIDGSRLYIASGSPYATVQLNPQTLASMGQLSGGQAYLTNIEMGSDGRLFSMFGSSSDLLNVSGADGSTVFSTHIGREVFTGQFSVSGDGIIAVANTRLSVWGEPGFVTLIPANP